MDHFSLILSSVFSEMRQKRFDSHRISRPDFVELCQPAVVHAVSMREITDDQFAQWPSGSAQGNSAYPGGGSSS
jgi:hypothetical protein